MDINLPGISGIEATRRIVAARPATVVVLLSTYAASDLPDALRTSGAACYVHKAQFGKAMLTTVRRLAEPDPPPPN